MNPQDALSEEVGKLLLALGVRLQTEMMRRVSQSAGPVRVKRQRGRGSYTVYTTPSKPGEYLRTRTGFLRSHITYQPTTIAEAGRQGAVQVGYERGAWYGGWWEVRPGAQRRKGLIDLAQELAPELARAGATFTARAR